MLNPSFSPYYPQDVIWVAKLSDGTLLREWDENGKETLFKQIPLGKLKEFHLLGEDFDYWLDCQTGVFVVDGRQYVFPLTGLGLSYGEQLIHYKDAFTELRRVKTHPYDGFGITGYNMGWKVTLGKFACQVIFSVPQKVFTCRLTLLEFDKVVEWKVKVP